ncbi:MAG: L,D-transpeptidase [Acidimicrobiales bacterium]|nr:L,D-transpeptidase [Acidimicrobiales bacterium]
MFPRRALAVLLAVGIVAGGCGSGTAEESRAASTTTTSTSTTTTTTTTSTVPPTTTAAPVTTSTVPADPYETFVANIREEVTILDAYETPDGEPAVFEFAVGNPTYFGNQLALMITDRTDDGEWLKVQIPVRPNGTEAWIRAADAEITSHRFRAEVNLTARAVTVWDGADLVVETTAVIGKEATPTPLGSFFVNDLIEKWDTSAYGPYILSLSGFSEAMDTFGGGVPVIAIHGTNRPDLMGGAHSNGCIRIPNDVVRVLADTVPIGTPVDIVA